MQSITVDGIRDILSKAGSNRELRLVNQGDALSLRGCVVASLGNACSNASDGLIALNRWYHVAMTYDHNADRRVHLFIDGQEVSYVAQGRAAGALAADATSPLSVQARVDEVGKIVSLEEINFGDYDPTSPTPTNASGAFSVRTTKGTTYKIYIGESGAGVRQLSDGGGSALDFELYTDPERTVRWAENPASAPSYTNNSSAVTVKTVYAKIPALLDVSAGLYTADLIVTMEF